LTVCAALAQYLQIVKACPNGDVAGPVMTSPFLLLHMGGAVAAESRGIRSPLRGRRSAELMLTNTTFALGH